MRPFSWGEIADLDADFYRDFLYAWNLYGEVVEKIKKPDPTSPEKEELTEDEETELDLLEFSEEMPVG